MTENKMKPFQENPAFDTAPLENAHKSFLQSPRKSLSLSIAHINDTHSYFDPVSMKLSVEVEGKDQGVLVHRGGYSRVAQKVKSLRQTAQEQGRPFLFLHAGDSFQGTLYFSYFKGKANAELLNAMGVDVMALGNHEFDLGNRPVADFLDLVHFPVMAANFDVSQERAGKRNGLKGKGNLLSYDPQTGAGGYTVHVLEGEPVAVFAVTLEGMDQVSSPDPDTFFHPVVETAHKTIELIKAQGINKIILLSHLGYEPDLLLAKELDVALIIGAHSHSYLGDFRSVGVDYEGPYAEVVEGTCIVQAGCFSALVGEVHLDFKADGSLEKVSGKNNLLLTGEMSLYEGEAPHIHRRPFLEEEEQSFHSEEEMCKKVKEYLLQVEGVEITPPCPEVEAIIAQKYRPAIQKQREDILIELEENLRHIRIPDEEGGSAISPRVASVLSWHAKAWGIKQPVIGLHNAGGVRISLNQGKVTRAMIAGRLLPFPVPLVAIDLKGKDLLEGLEGAIENAITEEGTGTGSFPYVSGLIYEYHSQEDKKFQNAKVLTEGEWVTFDLEKVYTVACPAYVARGKEGYGALTRRQGDWIDLESTAAEVLVSYIQDHQEFPSEGEAPQYNLFLD